MLKTHTNGELNLTNVGQSVTLAGWVNRRRDHGGLIFIDLRDRFGLTQVTIDIEEAPAAHVVANQARSEFVLQVKGKVVARPEGLRNPSLATGDIEVTAEEVTILNPAKTPPFYISGSADEVDEMLRLKYRYLDLRRTRMTQNLILRHEIVRAIRNFLSDRSFLEIETPILLKSTPEGARDFIVPSRLQPGEFYALPQSPQQLKQLLMVAGIERYFQIARCFRDEDLRADRQPEFTQLDLEMSFVEAADIRALIEVLLIELTGQMLPHKQLQQLPFPVVRYADAVELYGIDRPDLRFGQQLFNVGAVLRQSGFGVFQNALAADGVIKGVVYPGGAELARREIDELTDFVKHYGAKGLVWIGITGAPDAAGHYPADHLRSQSTKFLTADEISAIVSASGAQVGDLILMLADKASVVNQALANLRLEIGKRANLIDPNLLAYCWVVDFPLLEWDEEAQALAGSAPSLHQRPRRRLGEAGVRTGRGAGEGLRRGAERLGDRRGEHPHPPQRPPGSALRPPGAEQGGDPGQVRPPAGGLPIRRAAARRHRPGHRPPGGALRRRNQHPRRYRLPEDRRRHRPHVGLAEPGRGRSARRAAHHDTATEEVTRSS